MVELDMVRRFAGVDPDADPANPSQNTIVLQACLSAAVEWFEKAGVPQTESPLYDLWVANLAAWFYDNRGNADAGANIPDYIVKSVHQLRPAGGVRR